jgi:hypothetical protein
MFLVNLNEIWKESDRYKNENDCEGNCDCSPGSAKLQPGKRVVKMFHSWDGTPNEPAWARNLLATKTGSRPP